MEAEFCRIGFILLPVFGREGDFSIFNIFDAVVADGDAVGIASKIFEDVFRPCKRAFGIDVPRCCFGFS